MGQDWFVKNGEENLGPLSNVELKRLAVDGKFRPETEVRLGLEGQWVRAGSVEGLLSEVVRELEEPIADQSVQLVSSSDSRHSISGGIPGGANTAAESDNPVAFARGTNSAGNPYQPTVLSEEEHVVLRDSGVGGLRVTRVGLLTCYYSICVLLICGIGTVVLPMLLGRITSPNGSILSIGILLMGLAFVWLGGGLAFVVGQVMCLFCPRDSGAKGYVKGALSMHLVWLLLTVVDSVGLLGDVSSVFVMGFAALTHLSIPVGGICFLLFLKKFALFMGQFDLASTASSVIKMSIVLVLGTLVYIFRGLFVMAGGGISWVILAGALVFMLTGLIVFIRSAHLMVRLARAIPKH